MENKLFIVFGLLLIAGLIYIYRRVGQKRVEAIKYYAEMNNGKSFSFNKELVFIELIGTRDISIELGYLFSNNMKVYITILLPGGGGFSQSVVESPLKGSKHNSSYIISPKKLFPIFISSKLFSEEYEYSYGVKYSNMQDKEKEPLESVIILVKMGYTVGEVNGNICVYRPREILTTEQISEIISVLQS